MNSSFTARPGLARRLSPWNENQREAKSIPRETCRKLLCKLYYLSMANRAIVRDTPKYRQIFKRLAHDIASGKYAEGQKLPSEATLVRQFGASRITVGRAVRELKDHGLVQRVAGSGTYVQTHPIGDVRRPLRFVDSGSRRNRNLWPHLSGDGRRAGVLSIRFALGTSRLGRRDQRRAGTQPMSPVY